jgi:hypothetical protein
MCRHLLFKNCSLHPCVPPDFSVIRTSVTFGVQRGPMPLQYFCLTRIIRLATQLNRDKLKKLKYFLRDRQKDRKKEKTAFYGTQNRCMVDPPPSAIS